MNNKKLFISIMMLVIACNIVANPQSFQLLKDIKSGNSGANLIYRGPVLQDKWLFIANDSIHGEEPWITDGTTNGTYLLADLAPGPSSSVVYALITLNNRIVFSADDGVFGSELWVSDGTTSGTNLLIDIFPGQNGAFNNIQFHVMFEKNGYIYFVANDGVHGDEIWKTDGTSSGTQLLKDIYPGPISSFMNYLPQYFDCDSLLFFAANNGIDGTEIWYTDGTANGTNQFIDANPGPSSSFGDLSITRFSPILLQSQKWICIIDSSGLHKKLVVSDGTPAGTNVISNFITTVDLRLGSNAYRLNGKILFVAGNRYRDWELWCTNGTDTGTYQLLDINQDTINGSLEENAFAISIEINGKVLFIANNGINGSEIWSTDGTTIGTTLLHDINQGSGSCETNFMTRLTSTNDVLFNANDSIHGVELWKTDGTSAATVLIKDIFPGPISGLDYFSIMYSTDSLLIFTGNDPGSGGEPWITNATTIGTYMLIDANVGPQSSLPHNLIYESNHIYFTASSQTYGEEIYITDGTIAGTYLLADIYPGPTSSLAGPINYINNSSVSSPLVVNSNPWIKARSSSNVDYEIWEIDETTINCQQVIDLNPGIGQGIYFGSMFASNNGLIFVGNDGVTGKELWILDTITTTGVSLNDKRQSHVILYPNPISLENQPYIYLSTDYSWDYIVLADISGRTIEERKYTDTIYLKNLSSGLYVVRLMSADGNSISKRLVIY